MPARKGPTEGHGLWETNALGNAAHSSDEETLIQRLSTQYRDAVRRYFLKRVRNTDEAEDLTQELFLRLVRRGKNDDIQDAESFLFQAASNLLRDRQRRRTTAGAFLTDYTYSAAQTFEVLSPERVLDSKQSLQCALEALDNLEAKCRNAFILHRLEGLRYVEIAQIYGVSVSAVEKYMMKANAAMAKHALRRQD